jgi:hypothetical protein
MSDNGELTHFNIGITNSEGMRIVLHCNPSETSLHLHSPEFREVDHLFHVTDDTDENQTFGAILWRHLIGEDAFDEFSQAMIESGNWAYHYRPEPLEQDMESFASSQLQIPETLPIDFS